MHQCDGGVQMCWGELGAINVLGEVGASMCWGELGAECAGGSSMCGGVR